MRYRLTNSLPTRETGKYVIQKLHLSEKQDIISTPIDYPNFIILFYLKLPESFKISDLESFFSMTSFF